MTRIKLMLSFGGPETWGEWWPFEKGTFKSIQRMTDHPNDVGMCVHVVFRENRMLWLLRPMAQHEESFETRWSFAFPTKQNNGRCLESQKIGRENMS